MERAILADPVFWSYVDQSGGRDSCWEWQRARDRDGYGRVKRRMRSWAAHRYAYTIAVGPVPVGKQIDHLCRNRACCNPAHLEPVTPRENTLRSPVAGAAVNASKTHCLRGHDLASARVRVTPSGRVERQCRECGRLTRRRRYLESKSV